MREAFQRFKSAVTGRWSVSMVLYALLLPLLVLFAVEREGVIHPGLVRENLSIVIAGEFAGLLILFIASASWLRNRARSPQPFLLVLFTWGITGLIRGLTSSLYARWAYGFSTQVTLRAISSIATSILFMGLASYFVGRVEKRRLEARALSALQDFLEIDESILMSSEVRIRRDSIAALQRTLVPLSESLTHLLASITVTSNSEEIKARINQMREQSEELALQVGSELRRMVGNTSSGEKLAPSPLFDYSRTLLPSVISVRITFALLASAGALSQYVRNGWVGVESALISSLLISGTVFIMSRPSKFAVGWIKALSYPASYLSAFGVQWLWHDYRHVVGIHVHQIYAAPYDGFKTVLALYLASIASSLTVDSTDSREAILDRSIESRRKLESMASANIELEKNLYLTQFGEINGKIAGIIMSLTILDKAEDSEMNFEGRLKYLQEAQELLHSTIASVASLAKGLADA